MRLQFLSDLHLESETFDPEPAPGAQALVLGGDIDRHWDALARFKGWPVPVLMVAVMLTETLFDYPKTGASSRKVSSNVWRLAGRVPAADSVT